MQESATGQANIHPSRKYITLAIEPRFRVCDIREKLTSQSRKQSSTAKVTYFPERSITAILL